MGVLPNMGKKASTPADITIDEIDRKILAILAGDPRIPYSDISEKLGGAGHQISSEAVRQRVSSLLDVTTSFFLIRPDAQEWEILMLMARTRNQPGAKQEAFDIMSNMDFWFVGNGFGTVDIYATATVTSTKEVETILTEVKELGVIAEVDYFVETNRSTAVERYLQID